MAIREGGHKLSYDRKGVRNINIEKSKEFLLTTENGVNKITISIVTKITVVESRTEEFNWLTMLRALVAGKLQANTDLHRNLKRLAADWPTCACGQLCKNLPKTEGSIPEDWQLRVWGGDFAAYVSIGQWRDALKCFEKIEARASSLLGY